MTTHEHVWTYHQPGTCGGTPVWMCDGPKGCGRYETSNPNPLAGPTITVTQ